MGRLFVPVERAAVAVLLGAVPTLPRIVHTRDGVGPSRRHSPVSPLASVCPPSDRILGYAQVSNTMGQNLDVQLADLRATGAETARVPPR
jgi:hypothetical protein